MAEAILTGRGVTKRFGGLIAVNAVEFGVDRGEIFGLIGPNGAGKTTLFRCISGMYAPTSGSITFAGRDIAGQPAHRICARGVVTTHQIVRPFLEMTVRRNVLVGVLYGRSGLRGDAADAEVDRVLELTQLAPHRETLARSLTLARRKRLEVARAPATRPDVLLLDEVAAGPKPAGRARQGELLRQIR